MIFGLDPTEFWITAGALALGLSGVAWMVILERRPPDITRPRLIPTTPVMLISAMVALLALVHIVNLFGIRTGR
jgi:amino acid transporter